jgi:hypothetical protein
MTVIAQCGRQFREIGPAAAGPSAHVMAILAVSVRFMNVPSRFSFLSLPGGKIGIVDVISIPGFIVQRRNTIKEEGQDPVPLDFITAYSQNQEQATHHQRTNRQSRSA